MKMNDLTPRGTVPPHLPDSKRHTRDLLNELHDLRVVCETPPWDLSPAEDALWRAYRAKDLNRMEELRVELATRPHIPGKLEGKIERQKAAKANRGQGKSRNR